MKDELTVAGEKERVLEAINIINAIYEEKVSGLIIPSFLAYIV